MKHVNYSNERNAHDGEVGGPAPYEPSSPFFVKSRSRPGNNWTFKARTEESKQPPRLYKPVTEPTNIRTSSIRNQRTAEAVRTEELGTREFLEEEIKLIFSREDAAEEGMLRLESEPMTEMTKKERVFTRHGDALSS